MRSRKRARARVGGRLWFPGRRRLPPLRIRICKRCLRLPWRRILRVSRRNVRVATRVQIRIRMPMPARVRVRVLARVRQVLLHRRVQLRCPPALHRRRVQGRTQRRAVRLGSHRSRRLVRAVRVVVVESGHRRLLRVVTLHQYWVRVLWRRTCRARALSSPRCRCKGQGSGRDSWHLLSCCNNSSFTTTISR